MLASVLLGDVSVRAEDVPRPATAVVPLPVVQSTAGLRYWYSSEQIHYGFYNRGPRAGNPTSLLDWTGMSAQSGEAFFKLRHNQTGLFVKALGGLGAIGQSGRLLDRDFYAGQVSFSSLRSDVEGAGLDYVMVDIGADIVPLPGLAPRFEASPFVGYHRWDDNPVSHGVFCEPSDIPRTDCGASATGVLYDSNVKALSYAARWDALRIGVAGSYPVFERLTLRGEIAWVPYAHFSVDDSHYLRQNPDPRFGIGTVPNVFVRGTGQGVETELFVDYALTSSITLGLGGRYWGLSAVDGDVRNRLSTTKNPVTLYDQERYGLLIEARYGF